MEITSLNWLTSPYATYDTAKNYFTEVLGEGSLSDRTAALFKKIITSADSTPNKEDLTDITPHLEVSLLHAGRKENKSSSDEEALLEENRLINIFKSVFGSTSLKDRVISISKCILLLGSLYVILKYGVIDPIIAYQSDQRKISSCSLSFESAVSSLSDSKQDIDNNIELLAKSYLHAGPSFRSKGYADLADLDLSFYQSQISSYNRLYDQCQKVADSPSFLCRSLSSCSLSAEKLLREIKAYDDYQDVPSSFSWSASSKLIPRDYPEEIKSEMSDFAISFEELGFETDLSFEGSAELKKMQDYFDQSSQWQSIKDKVEAFKKEKEEAKRAKYKQKNQNHHSNPKKENDYFDFNFGFKDVFYAMYKMMLGGGESATKLNQIAYNHESENLNQAERIYRLLVSSRGEDLSSRLREQEQVIVYGETLTLYTYQDDFLLNKLARDILEIHQGASAKERKRAYRKLSLLVHPDKLNAQCTKEKQTELPYCRDINIPFTAVSNAYDFLTAKN